MSPKDGMTVETVSLAVLAVLGVVGLAHAFSGLGALMRDLSRACRGQAVISPA